MEAKIEQALSMRRKADSPWWAHTKASLSGLVHRAQECSGQACLQLQNWLVHKQDGWRESSISNQTLACLWQIFPHRPFSEQSTAESRTNMSFKGPMFHLIEFRLNPETLMLFQFLCICRDSQGSIPPTSQDLLTWEACHCWSLPIILK